MDSSPEGISLVPIILFLRINFQEFQDDLCQFIPRQVPGSQNSSYNIIEIEEYTDLGILDHIGPYP